MLIEKIGKIWSLLKEREDDKMLFHLPVIALYLKEINEAEQKEQEESAREEKYKREQEMIDRRTKKMKLYLPRR